MRVVFSLLAMSAIAVGAAAGFLLIPETAGNRLAEVTSVDDRGVARLSPSSNTPRVQPHVEHQVALGEPRFFGSGMSRASGSASVGSAPSTPATTQTPQIANTAVQRAPWQTDVTLAPRSYTEHRADTPRPNSGPSPSQVMIATGSLPARREISPDAMIRDIQRELRRVGCYQGEIDGAWGPGSQRAMAAFLQRANSTLPTTSPDLVQLTLVRGYSGAACGTERGVMTAQGAQPPTASQLRTTPIAPAPQIAVRALPPQAAPATQQSMASSQPTSFVARPYGQPSPPVVIFDGRMAVGGPRNPEPPGAGTPPPLTSAAPGSQTQRITRSAPPSRSVQSRRRERNWTATFFNQ